MGPADIGDQQCMIQAYTGSSPFVTSFMSPRSEYRPGGFRRMARLQFKPDECLNWSRPDSLCSMVIFRCYPVMVLSIILSNSRLLHVLIPTDEFHDLFNLFSVPDDTMRSTFNDESITQC